MNSAITVFIYICLWITVPDCWMWWDAATSCWGANWQLLRPVTLLVTETKCDNVAQVNFNFTIIISVYGISHKGMQCSLLGSQLVVPVDGLGLPSLVSDVLSWFNSVGWGMDNTQWCSAVCSVSESDSVSSPAQKSLFSKLDAESPALARPAAPPACVRRHPSVLWTKPWQRPLRDQN